MQGGYRSGKTVFGVAAVVDMGFRSDGAPILAIEPTYRMVADVFVATAQRMLDLWGVPWRYHKSDRVLRIGRHKTFDVFCRSADKPRALEGLTVGGLLADEWELFDREALQAAMARVSVGPCQQIVLTGTPEGYGAGYDLILARPAHDTVVRIIPSSANTTLRADYVADMATRLDADEANEKLAGQRREKGGRVYSRFDRAVHGRVVAVAPSTGQVQIWCDFNVGRMVWVVVEVNAVGKAAHIVGEWVGVNTDTAKQASEIKTYLAAYLTRTRRRAYSVADVAALSIPAYCDASGTQRHASAAMTNVMLMKQAGFKPMHGQRNPLIDDRVNTVQVMLRDRRLTIDVDKAPTATMTLERQAYVNGQPDKANGIDAAADGIGYGCHWQFPVWRPAAQGTTTEQRRDEWGPIQ